jgi:uncharacterized protein (TIGR01244 family)
MNKTQIQLATFAVVLAFVGFGCSGTTSTPSSAPESKPASTPETQTTDQPSTRQGVATATPPAEQLPNGRLTDEGILVGGQPTQDQFIAAADNGIRTVINLRTEGEEGNTDPDFVESLGVTYVVIPIGGAEALSEENSRRFATALEEAEAPVMVHCGSGNRVGALFALKAYYVDGLSAEEALVIGQETGATRIEPMLRQKLGLPES